MPKTKERRPVKRAPVEHEEAVVEEHGGEYSLRAMMPKLEEAASSKLATVAAVGLAVALIEVELIPGMLLGVAAMLAPNVMPKLGKGLRPFVKGAVRTGYAMAERAKETMAEASEQFQDIVAEVKADGHADHNGKRA